LNPKTHFDIILQTIPTSSKWPLPFGFSDQNTVRIFHVIHARYMPIPSFISSTWSP
jgi:hypothetical protein